MAADAPANTEFRQVLDTERTAAEPRDGQWWTFTGDHGARYQVLVQDGHRAEYEYTNIDGSIDTCSVSIAGKHTGRLRNWHQGLLASVICTLRDVATGPLVRWNSNGSLQQASYNGADGAIALNIAAGGSTIALGGYRGGEQAGLWIHMEESGKLAVTSYTDGKLNPAVLGFDTTGHVQFITDMRGQPQVPSPELQLGDIRAYLVNTGGPEAWRLTSVAGTDQGKPVAMTCDAAGLPVQLACGDLVGDISWAGEPLAVREVRLVPRSEPALYVQVATSDIGAGVVSLSAQHDAQTRVSVAARVPG